MKIAACLVCLLALFDEKFPTSRGVLRLESVVDYQSPNLGLKCIRLSIRGGGSFPSIGR